MFQKLKNNLFLPSDIAALVFFRLAFGTIMLWEVTRYFNHNWISRYWIEPEFHFHYEGFYWLSPWTGNGMIYHFYALGLLAFFIAIGFLYRISTILFFLGFSFIFLLDKSTYLNHFYLITLLSFILIFLPAHKAFSVDSLIFPKLKTDWVPSWTLWVLKLQLGVVYFFGGVAKLNSDWLQGEPIRDWLADRSDFPLIGSLFTEEWMVYFFAYSGLLLDLLIFPFLIFKKTRIWAFIAILSFHLLNSMLFDIGIFPWFMIAATLVFFPSEKFRFWKMSTKKMQFNSSYLVLWGFGIYFLIQVLLPLRHWLYKGNVNWTEEGHRFSWHMKLRSKDADAFIFIVDKDNDELYEVELEDYLSSRQVRKFQTRPGMIVQFAHYMADDARKNGMKNVAVTAEVYCSLNGRADALLIDSVIDLSKINYAVFEKADWILPLNVSLQKRAQDEN